MRMSHLASIVFACSISLFSTASFAQSPSNDGICDELHGATPSLYGLCIAYWATQSNGNSEASSKILEKYDARKSDGDPDMPGLVTCPCWTAEQLGSWRDTLHDDFSIDPTCSDTSQDFVAWSDNTGVQVEAVRSSNPVGSCYASINMIGVNVGAITELDEASSGVCHDELVENLCL